MSEQVSISGSVCECWKVGNQAGRALSTHRQLKGRYKELVFIAVWVNKLYTTHDTILCMYSICRYVVTVSDIYFLTNETSDLLLTFVYYFWYMYSFLLVFEPSQHHNPSKHCNHSTSEGEIVVLK